MNPSRYRSAAPAVRTARDARAVRRSTVVVVSALAVVALVASSCKRDSTDNSQPGASDLGATSANVTIAPSGDPKMGGKLTYGVEAETDSMKPTKGRWAIAGLMYANAVFDPVAAYDKNGEPQPYLAEKFTHSDDYLKWTITFRPGIFFHNGEALNADAGILFINALKDSPLTGPAASPIADVKKTGELSAELTMKVPWVAFPHILTGQGGLIPAPQQMKDDGPDGSSKPIGTGPFVFKEWVRDSHFTAVRNEKYWRKDAKGRQLPYLSEVDFRPIPDTQSRVDALAAGDINMVHDSHAQSVEKLKQQAKDGKVQFILGGGEDEESFVMLNTKAPPLDDVRLRQAIAYATNLDEYFRSTQEPSALVADSPFNKDGKWYVDPGYPKFDQAKARQLIADWQKDHPGQQVSFSLATTPAPENTQITQLLKNQWEEVGMRVELKSTDQVTFILGAITGQYQADLWRQFSAPDPDTDMHFWTGRNGKPNGDTSFRLNFSNNQDPELDKALDEGRSNPDPVARKAAYATVARRMAAVVPYVWLQHVRWSIAADNTVRGFLNGPLPDGQEALGVIAGVHRLTFTWIDK